MPDVCSAVSLLRRNVSRVQLGVRFSDNDVLVNVGNHCYTWPVRPHATTTIWRRVPLEYNPLWFNPGQRLHLRMTTQTGVNPRAWPGPIHCVPNWISDCSMRLGTSPSMLPPNVNVLDIYRYSGRGRVLGITGTRVLQRDAIGQLAMISF